MEQWPEDGRRYELYDGEVWEMPSPTLQHQGALMKILRLVDDYAERVDGRAVVAPFDIVFSEYDVVQPDVVYFNPLRAQLLKWTEVTRYRPDLCVEVLSPGTLRNDRGRKMQMFVRYGVPEYWILDPFARTIEMLLLQEQQYVVAASGGCQATLASPLQPDLSVTVARVFEDC
jgi:Uma2 family endonuclease